MAPNSRNTSNDALHMATISSNRMGISLARNKAAATNGRVNFPWRELPVATNHTEWPMSLAWTAAL